MARLELSQGLTIFHRFGRCGKQRCCWKSIVLLQGSPKHSHRMMDLSRTNRACGRIGVVVRERDG